MVLLQLDQLVQLVQWVQVQSESVVLVLDPLKRVRWDPVYLVPALVDLSVVAPAAVLVVALAPA